MSRTDAEAEAVCRFGSAPAVAQATFRQSLLGLGRESSQAATFLAGVGLVSVGVSGLAALLMNLLAGRSFVGGQSVLVVSHASVAETADDAVTLRVLAGVVGLALLLGSRIWSRRATSPALLPTGLVDTLAAAAFAAATLALTSAAVDQAVQRGAAGVGFALSGALVALPATVYFGLRGGRALLRPPVPRA